METVLSVCLGIALAAACGFRVFVPLLALSLASHAGWVEVTGGFAWLASVPALVTFSVAVVLEVGAYYVPWLDNLLDAAAAPLATAAGVLVSVSVFEGLDPLARWTLAIVAGGGAAASIHGLTAMVRGASTLTTGGLGNWIVASIEWLAAALLSALAVILPIIAVAAVVVALMIAGVLTAARRRAPAAT
jgi:hypothetical protein